MKNKTVCVPVNSPAWWHYIRQGWIQRRADGSWATLIEKTSRVATRHVGMLSSHASFRSVPHQ